ncbi:hypothetical protein NC796_00300 [Aliifodinibius sp. S!AR15-10]|uniref:glycosyltransferase family protein n=1 Tax=Aliifodinibius sp. S!AR15-10 TaxID=2950437 RepID=UPI00285D6F94|nr:glycosyltransferase family protein [Aliifodinibius sp. S!AR15-10]MDR8389553.1 hypothetical protein [Aliifodinibius sp. S!AR15-10]
MKVLYGIQGTGHGHISRAKELLPVLSKQVEVDVLISGYNCKLNLDSPVRYRKYGISMSYDSNGGVSVLETLRSLRPIRFLTDIQSIPIREYDLVVSDYEPVTAWAARAEKIPSVGLSHQAAFLSMSTPRPEKRSTVAEAILQHFAPTDHAIGFHFKAYDRFVEPPIIRSEILQLDPSQRDHITVYLPAYDPEVLTEVFQQFDHYEWHIFSPDCEQYKKHKNVLVHPVSNRRFLESFESCSGVVTSSGFEMCAESMYMGKKLLTVPIRNQYEQLCNAAAMSDLGVTVLDSIPGQSKAIGQWLESGQVLSLDKVADVGELIPKILSLADVEDSSSSNSAGKSECRVAV